MLALEDDGVTYSVRVLSGRSELVRGRDLKLLLRQTWSDLSVDLGPWSLITRGENYAVTLEMRLLRQDVSGLAKNALFFWSFDAVPAARYQLDFSY